MGVEVELKVPSKQRELPVWNGQETYLESDDEAYAREHEPRQTRRSDPLSRESNLERVVTPDTAGPQTENEKRTYAELERFKEKRRAIERGRPLVEVLAAPDLCPHDKFWGECAACEGVHVELDL